MWKAGNQAPGPLYFASQIHKQEVGSEVWHIQGSDQQVSQVAIEAASCKSWPHTNSLSSNCLAWNFLFVLGFPSYPVTSNHLIVVCQVNKTSFFAVSVFGVAGRERPEGDSVTGAFTAGLWFLRCAVLTFLAICHIFILNLGFPGLYHIRYLTLVLIPLFCYSQTNKREKWLSIFPLLFFFF